MSFEDITGQGRVFSSYLFVGADGVGKLLAAENFAKALGCPPRHPDFFLVEPSGASSSIGIEEIRDVIHKANLKPYEARKKVFIIKDAHAMNAEASNAFLKTLEEPPKDNVFILISRSKELLLPTVVSRCHIIRFWRTTGMKRENRDRHHFSSFFSIEKWCLSLFSYSNKEELKENLEFLVSFFRDIFIYKAVRNEAVILHVDRIDKIKRECDRFTLDELDYLIKRVITLRSYIDYNVNPKIIVDVLTNELRNYYVRSSASKAA